MTGSVAGRSQLILIYGKWMNKGRKHFFLKKKKQKTFTPDFSVNR